MPIKSKTLSTKNWKTIAFPVSWSYQIYHICQTHVNDSSHRYLEKYFSDVLDGIDKELAIKELKLTPAKSKTILALVEKNTWRRAVQNIIQNETFE